MKFELSEKEYNKYVEWKSKHEEVHTTIGDRYSFKFTPTAIGTFVSVYDPVTKEELLLSDYEDF
jgi:hypothetical protein